MGRDTNTDTCRRHVVNKKILEDLLKNAMTAAFLDFPDVEKKVNIEVSKLDQIDYQFNIRGLESLTSKKPIDIFFKFKEKICDNQLIKRVQISENESYINIFTRISRHRPCKTCGNDTMQTWEAKHRIYQ